MKVTIDVKDLKGDMAEKTLAQENKLLKKELNSLSKSVRKLEVIKNVLTAKASKFENLKSENEDLKFNVKHLKEAVNNLTKELM